MYDPMEQGYGCPGIGGGYQVGTSSGGSMSGMAVWEVLLGGRIWPVLSCTGMDVCVPGPV